MSIPDFNSDISPYNLGVSPNNSDDDAEILDNLIESDATPPEPEDIPRFDIPPVPKVDIPPRRIIRARTIFLTKGISFPLVPSNPWRTKTVITVPSSATLVIATDPQYRPSLSTPGDYLRVWATSSGQIELETTEALWVAQYSNDDASGLPISYYEEIMEEKGR